ncbi:MAG: hypothetical protein ACR2QW_03615 [bacterium]
MKISWTTKLSLFVYKYITGPFTKSIVALFQFFFVWLDKITGNEVEPLSEKEALREYLAQNTLEQQNVPEEFRMLLPLATKWGIGDDAYRGDITEAATSKEKQELVSALTGKLGAIDRWITSFTEGAMTDEAAAFMYMLEAVEEMELEVEYE